MRRSPVVLRASFAFLLLTGCKPDPTNPPDAGGVDDGAATTEPGSDAESSDLEPADLESGSAPEPVAESEPEPPKRERIRIHNSCSKQVNLRIERVNDSDTNTSLTSNTTMEERATDGDEVRLLDEKYAVIHAVTIEASMQEVDVASSCTEIRGK